MKNWIIYFSIKYTGGGTTEGQMELEAATIDEALAEANRAIKNPSLADPKIEDFVIWDVGIKEDDVF